MLNGIIREILDEWSDVYRRFSSIHAYKAVAAESQLEVFSLAFTFSLGESEAPANRRCA